MLRALATTRGPSRLGVAKRKQHQEPRAKSPPQPQPGQFIHASLVVAGAAQEGKGHDEEDLDVDLKNSMSLRLLSRVFPITSSYDPDGRFVVYVCCLATLPLWWNAMGNGRVPGSVRSMAAPTAWRACCGKPPQWARPSHTQPRHQDT